MGTVPVGILGLGLTLLAGVPIVAETGGSRCTDDDHNDWLAACAMAAREVRRVETVPTRDPWGLNQDVYFDPEGDPGVERWKLSSDILFIARDQISTELVAACRSLVADPSRIPSEFLAARWPDGWPPLQDKCTTDSHVEWLAACEQEARELRGKRRVDVGPVFRPDGGLSTHVEQRFWHHRCRFLKVHVRFELVLPGQSSDVDRVESASAYLGSTVID